MTLRLLHFADLHLGVEAGGRPDPVSGLNQRVVDVCARLDEVCEAVEAEGVHAVLFAGDAFKHQHPTPTLQSLFAARIRRMARAGASVFLLVGNHDLPKSQGLRHPFDIYEALEVEGVVVGARADLYEVPLPPSAPSPVLQIAALPHFSREAVLDRTDDTSSTEWIAEAVAARISELAARADRRVPAVFVGHCHVNQAELGDGQPHFGLSDLEISLSTLTLGRAFPYYALGHVHHAQVLCEDPFVAYAGSVERLDFGEGEEVTVEATGRLRRRPAREKGFFRFDLEEEGGTWRVPSPPRFCPVRARTFITVRVGDLGESTAAEDLSARFEAVRAGGVELEGAFVRVVATGPRPRLTQAEVRRAVPEAYDVQVRFEMPERTEVRDPWFAHPRSEAEALERYLALREDWADDRAELLQLGRGLIAEALDRP